MDILLICIITVIVASHIFIAREITHLRGLAPAIAMNIGSALAVDRQKTQLTNKIQFIFFLLIVNSVTLFSIVLIYSIQGTLNLMPFLYFGYLLLIIALMYAMYTKDPIGFRRLKSINIASIINMVLVGLASFLYLRAFFGI